VSSAQEDTSPSNNSVPVQSQVNPAAVANLSLSVGGASGGAARLAQNFSYSINVANAGPADATGVVIDLGEAALQGAEFVSSTCPGTLDRTICRGFNVPAGQSRQFTYTIKPTVVGQRTITASVDSEQNDSTPVNNTSSVTTTVTEVDPPSQTAVCTPRPQVEMQTRLVGDGRMEVNLTAGGINNAMQSINFGTAVRPVDNARVDIPSGPSAVKTNFVHPLPPNTERFTFYIRHDDPNKSTTVPFVVNDKCGAWELFVGGGRGSF
jgi:hypothetical protein